MHSIKINNIYKVNSGLYILENEGKFLDSSSFYRIKQKF